jgi:energy-coupling factor transporter transmembrane protein EcfT
MSFKVWDAGKNQNMALFIMVLSWALLILFGIAQTNFQWNAPSVVGLIFVIGILYTWAFSFTHKKPCNSSTKETVAEEDEMK